MSLYRNVNTGVDLDSIFAARLTAPGPAVNYRNADGLDLNQRYEKYNGVGVAAPVGYRGPNGLDLNTYFTTIASTPVDGSFTVNGLNPANNGSVNGVITFGRNGTVSMVPSSGTAGSGAWAIGTYPEMGDLYQIQFFNRSAPAGVTWGGDAINTWLSLSSQRSQSLSRTGNGTFNASVQAQIRRASDSVVLANYTLGYSLTVGSA